MTAIGQNLGEITFQKENHVFEMPLLYGYASETLQETTLNETLMMTLLFTAYRDAPTGYFQGYN